MSLELNSSDLNENTDILNTLREFKSLSYRSNSPEDTAIFAKVVAKYIPPSTVIALNGSMGAGKTAFAKFFAEGLGIKSAVSSPTFTIMNIYQGGRLTMYHFDAYRIENSDEMLEIGFEEFLYGDGVCIVEWAELIKDILPSQHISIKIDVLCENQRLISIKEECYG